MYKTVLQFFLFLIILPVFAQEERVIDFTSYKPEINIVRIQTDEAPVIDADLTDAVWSKATKIDEFYQIDPVAGAKPSEETIVYIF